MENITETSSGFKQLELNKHGIEQLEQTRKWTLFFSILGFIFIGIMVLTIPLTFIFGNTSESTFLSIGGSLVVLVLVFLLYFPPIYFLYQFSTFSKEAVLRKDSRSLGKALENLRKHYQFMGVLTVILLVIYLIAGFIAGAASVF